MICPECQEHRPAFSIRCPHCTARTGMLYMWMINLMSWIIVLALLAFTVMWLIK